MKREHSIKNKVMLCALIVCLLMGMVFYLNQKNAYVKALTERPEINPSGLIISGSEKTISYDEKSNQATVYFDFNTTDAYYDGFYGGGYVVQWDSSKMDIVKGSVNQADSITNYDYNKFTCNGVPASEGMILISCSQPNPSQNNRLSITFENLFKDNSEGTIEVNVIPRSEDEFFVGVAGTGGNEYVYISNPTIKKAKLTLEKPTYLVSGKSEVIKGTKANAYQTTIPGNANWSITGQTSASTIIDSNGNVAVGIDETSSSIEVISTSVADSTIITKKQVKLIDKTYSVKRVELPKDKISINEGKTEGELVNELDVIKKAKVFIETNEKKEYSFEVDIKDFNYDQKSLNDSKKLVVGLYEVIYNLQLPYLEINENDEMKYVNDITTNIKGKDTATLSLEVLKNNEVVVPPENPNDKPGDQKPPKDDTSSIKPGEQVPPKNNTADKDRSNNKKPGSVVTNDSVNVDSWLLSLSISLAFIVFFKSVKRKERN